MKFPHEHKHFPKGRPQEKNTEFFGNFSQHRGGGLLIPKTFVILTIALKTPLKHLKITQKFPTLPKKNRQKMVEIPKRGGGGGGPTFGKNSQKIPYFFSEAFPYRVLLQETVNSSSSSKYCKHSNYYNAVSSSGSSKFTATSFSTMSLN